MTNILKIASLTVAMALTGAGAFGPAAWAAGEKAAGLVDTLVKPENKATLTKVLTYHVVPGTMTASDLMKAIKSGGGKATLTTAEGGPLTAEERSGKIVLVAAKGGTSAISTGDVMQSNGVVHVVDSVLMPN